MAEDLLDVVHVGTGFGQANGVVAPQILDLQLWNSRLIARDLPGLSTFLQAFPGGWVIEHVRTLFHRRQVVNRGDLRLGERHVIDRCMPVGRVDVRGFARYLNQARSRFDWSKEATGERAVSGFSGNKAALILAAEMAEELTDDTGGNVIREIQDQLRAQLSSKDEQ